MNRAVVIDRNSHTAILLGQGPKYVRLVQMHSGQLVVSRLTEDEFAGRGYAEMDYDLARAVARFLAHSGGVSTATRAALEACLRGEEPSDDTIGESHEATL